MNFNTAQKEAINSIYGNYAVIATAGSGKTKNIVFHRLTFSLLRSARKQKRVFRIN